MGIKRYFATADNTITNAFDVNLTTTRATGSNMGSADILETFSIYGQKTTSSVELSRILVKFPVTGSTGINTDRTAGKIPESGSVSFFLKMYNARHSEQLPKNCILRVLAVSSSWQEGTGIDMDNYKDITEANEGSNWVNANNAFNSATATLILQGGANLAALDAQTFILADAGGNSQTFTFDFDGTSLTNGAIGFDGDSNTTDAINSIKTAINNISALNITAGTIAAAGDSDSQMTLTLTQDNTGYRGNTDIDTTGVTSLTSTNFRGGSGQWAHVGGDFHTGSANSEVMFTFDITNGTEDLEVDVTQLVEEWILGDYAGATQIRDNFGFAVFLSSSYEGHTTASDEYSLQNSEGATKSYYTKRFFSRSSEYFFKRPVIEARWDSRISDDRNNFYYSSSLASGEDNLNTVYLYNYVRGRLRNIPSIGQGHVLVSIYSGSEDNTAPSGSKLKFSRDRHGTSAGDLNVTGGYVSTGIYSASFAFTGSTDLKTIYDVWHNDDTVPASSPLASHTHEYHTGTITPKTLASPSWNQYTQYTTKITNLKPSYNKGEQARFRVFTRPRDYTPTVYSVATKELENTIIQSASYEIIRVADNKTVINNSTSSTTYHTYLSYDNSGSYFDFDMSMLEPGYLYGVKLSYHSSDDWREQEEIFKFRVEDN